MKKLNYLRAGRTAWLTAKVFVVTLFLILFIEYETQAGTVGTIALTQTGSNPIYGTPGTTTYTITITVTGNSGNNSCTLSFPNLPTGVTAAYDDPQIINIKNGTPTRTLTITTTSNVAAGAITFTVSNSDNAVTGSGTLTIK